MIDVSQSVEHDHPHAFDFLRNDIKNAEDFFAKRGVTVVGLRRAFDFITVPSSSGSEATLSDSAAELERVLEQPDNADDQDAVFAQSWIPRRLNEVADPERDVQKVAAGQSDTLIYSKTVGVAAPAAKPSATDANSASANTQEEAQNQNRGDAGKGSESSEGSDTEEGEEEDDEEEEEGQRPRGKKFEDKEAKKVRLFYSAIARQGRLN